MNMWGWTGISDMSGTLVQYRYRQFHTEILVDTLCIYIYTRVSIHIYALAMLAEMA